MQLHIVETGIPAPPTWQCGIGDVDHPVPKPKPIKKKVAPAKKKKR